MLEKLAYNKTTILKNAFSIVLLLMILIVEGCFNFLTFEFKIERLSNLGFWTGIATKVVLLLLVKMWVMSIFIDIARKKNPDLIYNKLINERLIESKDDNFQKWVENVENVEIKIEFYKRKMHKLIAKLEHNATQHDRMLFYKDDENLKSNNEYCIKRAELEYLISDEYIVNNIAWLDINNYPMIDSAIFDCPIGNENIHKKYQLSARTKSAIFGSLLVASISFLFIQTIWNAIELGKSDLNALVIFSTIIMDFIFIIWQGLTGINTAFNIVEQQEVLPYVNRNRILEKYLYYKNPDNTSQVKEYLIQMKRECKNVKE